MFLGLEPVEAVEKIIFSSLAVKEKKKTSWYEKCRMQAPYKYKLEYNIGECKTQR